MANRVVEPAKGDENATNQVSLTAQGVGQDVPDRVAPRFVNASLKSQGPQYCVVSMHIEGDHSSN